MAQQKISSSLDRVFYGLTVDFPNTIAAAGNDQQQSRVNNSYDFIAQGVYASVFTQIIVGTSIAQTPFADGSDPSPPAAVGNIWPTFDAILFQMKVNDSDRYSVPTRMSNCVGRPGKPHWYLTPIRFAAGLPVIVTLTNQLAAIGFRAQVTFEGYYVKPGAPA